MRDLRVATWNIRHGLGNDGVVDLERIATAIAAMRIDTIALQEIDRGWSRSNGVDQAAWLAERLGMNACFGANLCGADGSAYGTAILSRWPIDWWRNTPLPSRAGSESRGHLVARITTRHGWLQVECTHLHWGGHDRPDVGVATRRGQVAALVTTLREPKVPVVLMGDFNACPGSDELEPLASPASGFRDAWVTCGAGPPGHTIPTHPVDPPERRIDYSWRGRDVACHRVAVVDTAVTRLASDHYPVQADLQLPVTFG